jgi:hypothetical protein
MSQATIIEDTLKSVGGINSALHQSNRESERFGQHMSFVSGIMQVLKIGAAGWVFSLTDTGQKIRSIVETLKEISHNPIKLDTSSLELQLHHVDAQFTEYMAQVASGQTAQNAAFADQLKNEQAALVKQLAHYNTRNQIIDTFNSLNNKSVKSAVAYFYALNKALDASHAINRSLIGSNASLTTRWRLTTDIFQAWSKTGASIDLIKGVVESLVERGRDLTGTFKDDLIVVTQLHQGLHLSVGTSAELVAAFGQLKVSGRDVGDSIANIVRDTALAGDEAARMASHLARAFAVLRPGTAGAAKEVADYLLQVEGRLKSATGLTGELEQLYARMATTTEGAAIAQMLGVNPDAIANNKQAARNVTEGISRLIENSTRGTTGMTRLSILEGWSQKFGLSVTTLSHLADAIDKTNKPLQEMTDLQTVWEQEVRNTGNAFGQLFRSLAVLGMRAFTPILYVVNALLTPLVKLIGFLSDFKVVTIALQTAAVIALPLAIGGILTLTRALYGLATAALGATGAVGLSKGAVGGILEPIQAMVTGLVTKIPSLLTAVVASPVFAAAMVAAAGYAGYQLGRYLDHKFDLTGLHKLQAQYEKSTQTFEQLKARAKGTIEEEIGNYVLKGDSKGLEAELGRYKNTLQKFDLNGAQAAQFLENTIHAALDQHFQRDVRESHGVAKPQADVDSYERMIETTESMLEVERESLRAQIDLRKDAAKQAEEKRRKDTSDLLWNHNSPFRRPGDVWSLSGGGF